jgi:hypothetical protein
MRILSAIKCGLSRFARSEDGSSTIEFVLVFPIFFGFLMMTYESGMISTRHVMLEHGVDVAVREVRIGLMPVPSRDLLRTSICDAALIIPDCENQLQIELLRRDPRAWANIPDAVTCIDRGAASQPVVEFTNGTNNELMVLRACARFDPVLPTGTLGKTIIDSNSSSAAAGSYALVSMSAFVVEPFQSSE